MCLLLCLSCPWLSDGASRQLRLGCVPRDADGPSPDQVPGRGGGRAFPSNREPQPGSAFLCVGLVPVETFLPDLEVVPAS